MGVGFLLLGVALLGVALLIARYPCTFGLHGQKGRGGSGSTTNQLIWCLACGKTWQSTYDGIEPGRRHRPDLSYGKPDPDDTGQDGH